MSKIPTSKQSRTPMCTTIGVAVSLALSAVLCAIAAGLVLSEKIGQETIPLLRYGITAISSIAGALTASIMAGKQYLIVSSAVAGIYSGALICLNWILFNGQFGGLLWTILCTLGSGVAIGFALAFGRERSSNKIKKYRFS